jgi:hypothetical protein
MSVGKIEKARANDLGVNVSGTAKNGQTVTLGHEAALQEIFGTQHPEMAEALLGHCLKVLNVKEASDDHPGSDERAFMIAAVAELQPRDAIERMLAVQMAATHVATIRSARWLANSENIPQVQSHYTGFNKLARTFATQVEALRKHRSGGKQTVIVQHVNVEDGGQAIVGNVETGGAGHGKR